MSNINENPESIMPNDVKVEFDNLSFSKAFEYSKEGRMIRPNGEGSYWWRLDMHSMTPLSPFFNDWTWQASEVFECIQKYIVE